MLSVKHYVVGTVLLLAAVGTFSIAPRGSISAATSAAAPSLTQTSGAGLSGPHVENDARMPAFKSDSDTSSTTQQTGAPAIKPTILNAAPMTPAFTETDVREYAKQHARGFGKIGVVNGPPEVSKVEFLAAGALEQKLNGNSGLHLAGDSLLCYVQYRGDFVVAGLTGTPAQHYPGATQVFDAHTGNILIQSTVRDATVK